MSASVYVPGAQGVWLVLPATAKDPGLTVVQPAALCTLRLLEYVPALHGSGVAVPSMQYEPAGQSSGVVVATVGQYMPTGQLLWHSVEVWYCSRWEPSTPGAHSYGKGTSMGIPPGAA